MAVTLSPGSGGLIFKFPFHFGVEQELSQIPREFRKYDTGAKAWIIHPQYGDTCARLAMRYFRERLVVPTPDPVVTSRRTVEVLYITTCKLKLGTELAASGCDADENWMYLFPESTFRMYFSISQKARGRVDHYAVLGITSSTPDKDVTSAYRRLVRQWHPDVCKEPDAEDRFKEVKLSYDILSDPIQRKKYDAAIAFQKLYEATQPVTMPVESASYAPPLRSGELDIEGELSVGSFVVRKIYAWKDIKNNLGQTLVASYSRIKKKVDISWVN